MRDTGLWSEIVTQLSLNKSLDEALAAAASKCQASPPLVSQLPVYRQVAVILLCVVMFNVFAENAMKI